MLGIDVSKASLSCTYVEDATRRILWQRTYANTPAGVSALLLSTPPASPLVLEPTGRYSVLVAKHATEAGRSVLLAEPKKARHYLQSLPSRAKTDVLDSYGLSLFALACPLSPYPLKDASVEALDQLLKARRGVTLCITSLRQRIDELPAAADTLKEAVRGLEEKKAALDQQIRAHTRRDARFDVITLLMSVPGIGPVTAASVASCLIARRFSHPDQFVAFIGLDPSVRQSGQKDARGALSKRGDPELRRLLYLAAQSNLRCKGSPFRELYQSHRDKGMPTTAALCVVARKLARTCWSLTKYNQPFDPLRVSTPKTNQPPNPLDTEP